ncbi:hypothetical protein RRG08_066028 [Elysia crispata]|uniref:Uncharacterized protein n=1 Tax=Elysia crispata TaxID=231223 RepID=A0AAE1D856_9GAST|nr:hypothetical protein RRG08_066028 [Elysia crispata]
MQHPFGQVEPADPSFIHHAAPLRTGGASWTVVHPPCSTPSDRWSQLIHRSYIMQHPFGQVEPADPSFIHHAAPLRTGGAS